MRRKISCFFEILLILTISIPVAASSANAEITTSTLNWRLPKNFIDPVTIKINDLKALNFDEAQIVVELKKLGMGWNPKTDEKWLGTDSTPEEWARMPHPKNPFAQSSSESILTEDYYEKYESLHTNAIDYTGYGINMAPGYIAASDGRTFTHYVTMHLGHAFGPNTPCWVEIGIANFSPSENSQYNNWYYTYASYDGMSGFHWIRQKTDMTAFDNYCIQLTGYRDGTGWLTQMFLNYQWVWSGHLGFELNQVDCSDEIFSRTQGLYTSEGESGAAHFKDMYLSTSSYSWVTWNAFVLSGFDHSPPYMSFTETHHPVDSRTFNPWTV